MTISWGSSRVLAAASRLAGPPGFAASLLVVAGCSDARPRPAEWTSRDSAGVWVVESGAPAWEEGEGLVVDAEPEVVIGSASGNDAQQLYQVRGATVLPGGQIAILNSGTSEVRFYDETGAHLKTVGREGTGPGEFGWPSWIGRLGDTLAVLDVSQGVGRITYLNFQGDLIGTEPLRSLGTAGSRPERMLPDGTLLQMLEDGRYPTTSGPFRREQRLVRWHNGAEEADTVATLQGSDIFWDAEGDGMIWYPPFGRVTSIAIGADRVFVGDGERFVIDAYDFEGRHRLRVRAAVHRPPITDELVSRWTEEETSGEWYRQRPGGPAAVRRFYESMPRLEAVPAYTDIEVDPSGRIWAQRYEMPGDPRNLWIVLDADGRWLGQVALPGGLDPLEFGRDYVLGLVTDELDVEHVQFHRIR